MALNLQSAIKITAEVVGLQDLGKLEKGILAADKAAGSLKDGLKSVASSDLFQAAAVGAAALGAAMVISAKAAIDFDSAFADVRKVVGNIDSSGLEEMRSTILQMSTEMPIAATELAKIFAAAGQAGIATKEIEQFATDVTKISVAFDMTAEEAGTAMAKLRTALGLSQTELVNLADAMNYLSNNTASTAKQITEFVLRTGTVGQSAGLTAEQTAAFGAAMISAGADTEVAATSFNNMIKALSRGESMTERQMSALKRLGLVTVDVAEYEQQLTRAVEQESRERLAIAEAETNALRKEIDRRYRDQLQGVTDAFEDETQAYQKSLRDRDKQQVNALQKQQDAEVNAAKARAESVGVSGEAEVERIKEFYERRIDALRDNTDAELKQRSRADRDRLQSIQDNMNDAKDIELNGLNERFEAAKQLEAKRLEQAKITAKAAAVELSKEVSQTLAKNLQTDAIGTITDVFNKIRALPREQQIPIISDLFGDEAKALMPLIQNQKLLADALELVGDKSKYAGSSTQEYLNRLNTTANSLKMAQNQLNVLAITFGETFAPALIATMKALAPIIKGFTWMIEKVPGLGIIITGLGTAFIGLVAIAPGLGSLVYLMKTLGITIGAIKIGGIFTGLLPIIGQIGTALAVVGRVLLGLFTGPVGWATLLITAGVIIYAFRDKVQTALNAIVELYKQFFTMIYDNFIKPYMDAHAALTQYIVDNFITPVQTALTQFATAAYESFNTTFIEPLKTLFTNVTTFINENFITPVKDAISNFATAAYNFLNTNFIEPAKKVFTAITTFISEKFVKPVQDTISSMIKNIATAFQSVKDAITRPFEAAMQTVRGIVNSILNGIGNAIRTVISAINNVIQGANQALARLKIPQIPYLPQPRIPKFADGGVVNGPTLAMVGEGGEREYIIPESKMGRASANYMSGARGGAVIPAFANGGVVGSSRASQGRNSTVTIKPQISIQTGPVMQMNGTNYVTMQDLGRAVQIGVRQTIGIIQGDMNMRNQMGLS